MKIYNRSKTKELQLDDIDLDRGRLLSDILRTKDESGNTVTEHILVYQPQADAKIDAEMRLLKALLDKSDYRAIKFAERLLSALLDNADFLQAFKSAEVLLIAKEFAKARANREAWRARINELEAFINQAEA